MTTPEELMSQAMSRREHEYRDEADGLWADLWVGVDDTPSIRWTVGALEPLDPPVHVQAPTSREALYGWWEPPLGADPPFLLPVKYQTVPGRPAGALWLGVPAYDSHRLVVEWSWTLVQDLYDVARLSWDATGKELERRERIVASVVEEAERAARRPWWRWRKR